jgi:hypothetical protein
MIGGRLSHGNRHLIPQHPSTLLQEGIKTRFQSGKGAVYLSFMRSEEGLEVGFIEVGGAFGLGEGNIKEKEHFEGVVERDPGKAHSHVISASGIKREETYHEITHSATYSMPTTKPRTDQYINHRSKSSSDAGRWLRVLYDA